jgi:hypothetical protein
MLICYRNMFGETLSSVSTPRVALTHPHCSSSFNDMRLFGFEVHCNTETGFEISNIVGTVYVAYIASCCCRGLEGPIPSCDNSPWFSL